MKVLITGGAGYIGSHCAKLMAREGHEVVIVDDLSTGNAHTVQWGPLEEGDLADPSFVEDVFSRHRPEAVIHFAGAALVGESMRDPAKYFRRNTVAAAELLGAMQRHGVASIVFSSTCATYGIPEVIPISEETPQRPVNPYGESKLMVERILRWHGEAWGLRWAALRYFNVAGADPEGELGEEHDPETHLIPLALMAAAGTKRQLSIFGTDYPTEDGTAVRDYVHVWDLCDAHRLALLKLAEDPEPLRLNLGTGSGYSVREVVEAVERVTGRTVPREEAGRRAGDPPVLVAAARRAVEVLGWEPRMSDLDTMIRHAWGWFGPRT